MSATPPRYRAWRFAHPDLGGDGLRLLPGVGIEMVAEEESVRQAIGLLLSTVPGERVMRPDYGCLVHRLIFAPNDGTTAGLAIHHVRSALERWEPRIEILALDAAPDPDTPGRLDFLLSYRVRATRRAEQLAFGIDLAGEDAL